MSSTSNHSNTCHKSRSTLGETRDLREETIYVFLYTIYGNSPTNKSRFQPKMERKKLSHYLWMNLTTKSYILCKQNYIYPFINSTMRTSESYYCADAMYFLLLLSQFLPVTITSVDVRMRKYCIPIIYLIFVWKTSLYTPCNIIQSIQRNKTAHIYNVFLCRIYIN